MRPGEITIREFEWQMGLLRDHFNVLSLRDALEHLERGCLPPRSVCITFDDGYADNLTVALPVLERFGFAATVFVSSGFLSGGQMWNDSIVEALRVIRPGPLDLRTVGLGEFDIGDEPSRLHAATGIIRDSKYLPLEQRSEVVRYLTEAANVDSSGLMLTHEGLKELRRRGVEIGGHTVSHAILASLDEDEARSEIAQCKVDLEAILGEPVNFFAYPNGRRDQDYRQLDANLVRDAGFVAAVTTNWGVSSPATSRFELPRFTPWDKNRAKYLIRMALNARQRH
ncbi:MAG: polysaccharide deacetylase family protein [Haliea sp.]|jgi:peptidoglycan/xylan/chitin deacetylase (PgdA/CDA1 family)